MQRNHLVAAVFLLSAVSWAQNPGDGSTQTATQFHGIKIVSSKFDAATSPQIVQLDFINDSPNTITAWAYCVYADKAKNDDPSQGLCTMVDAVGVEVDRLVQEKITQKTNPADCPTCRFIHPGQHRVLSSAFALPVTRAEIQLKLIAYSDGMVERSTDQWGTDYFQQLLQERQVWLKSSLEAVDVGQKILAAPGNPHPAQSMINELENRSRTEPWMQGALTAFKQPEWRHGNHNEFLPEDERAYLSSFVAEHRMQATEFSKYLIQEMR